MSEVSAWFRERGFELALSREGADWLASLQRIGSSAPAVSRYGKGDSREAAAIRARARYEEEQ